jgi:hypothetical protein
MDPVRLNRYAGWATPTPLGSALAYFAAALKHRVERHDCTARRQGRCPGLDHCHDCAWSQGVSRDGTDR